MNKIIFILLLNFFTVGSLIADTLSYNCIDINDKSISSIINIDNDSIHSNNFLTHLKSTKYTNDKKSLATHFFMNKNKKGYIFGIKHYKDKPDYIQLSDYRANNIVYEYDCIIETLILSDKKIPITMKGLDYNKKIQEFKNSKKIKIINANSKK